MKILFLGDICFKEKGTLTRKESDKYLEEALPFLNDADFVLPNLETPLAEVGKYQPIKKDGPNIISPKQNLVFLQAMGAKAVTLGNNHIGDYGDGALLETLEALNSTGIAYTGAGKSIEEAYAPVIFEKDGISVSIFSVCEHEFGVATESTCGCGAYNPSILLKKIKEQKEQNRRVVVAFHGGNEYNPLPSPDTVERYRFICDMGADAVIAMHTHCPQGYEIYGGKPIVYSLGNFIFKNSNRPDPKSSWYYGYMCGLTVSSNSIDMEIIPYKFDLDASHMTVFNGEDKKEMLSYIEGISEIIKSPSELEKYFSGWAWDRKWCPSLEDWDRADYKAQQNYNLMNCEAHASLVKQVFKIIHLEKENEAEEYSIKIKELLKMPL